MSKKDRVRKVSLVEMFEEEAQFYAGYLVQFRVHRLEHRIPDDYIDIDYRDRFYTMLDLCTKPTYHKGRFGTYVYIPGRGYVDCRNR